jgi:hypothetical protein
MSSTGDLAGNLRDDSAQMRRRQAALRDQIQPAFTPISGSPAVVGCVFGNPTLPTLTGEFFSINPVDITGAEIEGRPGTLSTDTSRSWLVYVVGSKAPTAGDYLVCHFTGNRWVAERTNRGPSGQFIPGCPCASVPSTLTMSVSKPLSNYQIFHNCTLQYYSPVASDYAKLALGSFAWLSTETFTDQFSTNPFRYYFSCYQGYYALSRVYAKTNAGPAYVDSIRYRWLAGFFGNTCAPFLLTSGSIFSGGDASCIVTISE